MFRKITTLLTAMVLAIAVLPAVAAYAATGSAALTSAANVFPGPGAPITLTVTNGEARPNILGAGGGDAIKFILVNVPGNLPTAACDAATTPAGWTCRAVNRSGRPAQVFYEATGNGIAPGGTLPVAFKADVNKPNAVQRASVFEVFLGATATDAEKASGTPTLTVRGLELVDGISLASTRTGADVANRFTSGQSLTATSTFKNLSEVPIAVTATLSNTNSNWTVGAPTYSGGTNTVPAGGTLTATFPITTAGQATGQDIRDLIAKGSGTAGGETGPAVKISGGAINEESRQQIIVEAAAGLAMGNRNSLTVQGAQTNLAPNTNGIEVAIDVTKSNFPKVVLDALEQGTPLKGSYLTLTADCGLPTCPSITTSLGKITEGGVGDSRTLPRSTSGANRNLRAHYSVNFMDLAAQGSRLNLDAKFVFAGTDDNGFPFSYSATLEDLLVIDLLGPVLRLNAPVGLRNTATPDRVNDGAQLRISGTIEHSDDLDTMLVRIASTVPGSGGNIFTRDVATQGNLGAKTACPDAPGKTCQSFSVTTTLPGNHNNPDGQDVTALGFFGSVVQTGEAEDLAGNAALVIPAKIDGNDVRQAVSIDNDHPDLIPTRVTEVVGGDPLVEALGYYITEDVYANGEPVVRVTWDAGSFADVVAGGCNPANWSVDGVNVTDVLLYDGSDCTPGAKGNPDAADVPEGANVNDRILVLDGEVNPANVVNFSYDPQGFAGLVTDPVSDALANRAYAQDGLVIDGRTPNLPLVDSLQVTRKDLTPDSGRDREVVGLDVDDKGTPANAADDVRRFHTNVNDLQIPVTNFVGGIDDLEILDADGKSLKRLRSLDGQESFALTQSDISLATCGGACLTERSFRFIRRVAVGNGQVRDLPGPELDLQFVFDVVGLKATDAELVLNATGDDTMTVTYGGGAFGENKIADNFYGSQFEWSSLREIGGQGSQDAVYDRDQAKSVSANRNAITIGLDFTGQSASELYAGNYEKFFFGPQYLIEDLAGNSQADAFDILPDGTLNPYTP